MMAEETAVMEEAALEEDMALKEEMVVNEETEAKEETTEDESAVKEETTAEEEKNVEAQIEEAMRRRVNRFKKQADSLTFEGVRRVLEKDLGMEKFALDVHKRFVKQRLLECLSNGDDNNASKGSGQIVDSKKEVESLEELDSKNNMEETCSEDEDKMEDSPVMGLLTGKNATKVEKEDKVNENQKPPSENSIKKALRKRVPYIQENSEKITMAGLRRLLEEDLELEMYTLDSHKKFISSALDEAIKSAEEVPQPKQKNIKKTSIKTSKAASAKESLDSLEEDSDEEDEDEVKPKKKTAAKQKMSSEASKKRKIPEKETKAPAKKRVKPVQAAVDDDSDNEGRSNNSEDSGTQSSAEKPVKKKEAVTPAYGKRVEHLKSVIKSCAMSVPPVIYKKVKQVPENKREAQLIKELEEILSKEGLSSNPSEKEIKEVRKRKERAKELEGIDTSNIVSSSRRRSTSSYAPPPKPEVPAESDGEEEDSEEDDDEDDDDDDDEDNDGDDDNQSEEEGGADEESD